MFGRGVVRMPKLASEKTERFNIRIATSQKSMIARAAALSHMDMTDFILDKVVPEAKAVIEAAKSVQVSKRDFERLLELLENPPRPNDRLRAAIAALPPEI